jgi:hypothetical protein
MKRVSGSHRGIAMRRIVFSLAVGIIELTAVFAQQVAMPQTGRQALLEMFFSKEPGTFVRHLPLATQTALEQSGAMASLQSYSLLMSQMQTQKQNFQTFETGSVLLSGEDPKTGQKVEITVEKEVVREDRDDIALSFLIYKDGQPQRTPYMPEITFSMKRESQIWKLNEISLTIHLPLADPDLLKAFTEGMKKQAAASAAAAQHADPPPNAGSDPMILAAMRTILTAEATYAATYPAVGYTCSLSDLDGFGGGERSEHQAMLINSGLASGKRYGYIFTISGCGPSPATSFHLTAVPNANPFGRKAFCADQSSLIRTGNDGNPAMCQPTGMAMK